MMSPNKNLIRLDKLHRTRENSLTEVARITDENIPKYRQVNYAAMRDLINERKICGTQALERISKLQNESHAMREQAELKISRDCWLNEQQKLNQQYRKYDNEHQTWLADAFNDPDLLSLFHEITKYRIWLEENTIKFRKTTVLPMMQLKEELESKNINSDNVFNVMDALQIVKKEQNELILLLDHEERQIEDELKAFKIYIDEDDEINMIEEGIPESVLELPCPDDELRVTMLQEFLIIDHKYRETLVDLDTNYVDVISDENGGWDISEHEMLVHLYEIYPVDLKKRRTCIYNHFHRYFPKRSRQEMLNHEEWCNAQSYYLKHKRFILIEWRQARVSLKVKTQLVFEEAFELQERLAQQHEEKLRQRAFCEQLTNQVKKWREKQLEVLEVRRKLEESKRQAELEKMRQENERSLKQRQQTKEKLAEYYSKKEEVRLMEHETEQKRLEEMQYVLAEQHRKDRERIKFRKEEYERKRQELLERNQIEEREELEREERLQALAERVRPHVEIDHARVLQPTKAYNAHRGLLINANEDINIQQELFPINTFKDRKLCGDIRVRLEQRLRDAGVIQTDYARQALAAVQKAPQRRDTQENKMWTGFTFKTNDIEPYNMSKPVKRDFISHSVFYGVEN
ncbi:unnamed protein product [Rotaria socialis]|uniref:Coiled-coil domain-containing protein 148 n=1 Tax=Rotaria socialis TaxID=392032 RepID=A0A820S5T5_9BILA|nr:unnamed protein product [Rotaria socialis]CAF4447818.1 unnamed protein product [Rotaria socialis]